MLSAQTTDARVNLVTPALFARAPTPAAMRELSVAEILALIKTCGLAPTKAKNLAALARLLGERHGDEVPPDMEALEALPGVGHKTASVVLSQAFGIPTFPVDTHIHRLAARWGLSDGHDVKRTEADLKSLYAPEHWGALHLQIIYFGREHCPALRHQPELCPICSWAAPAPKPVRKTVAAKKGAARPAVKAGKRVAKVAARRKVAAKAREVTAGSVRRAARGPAQPSAASQRRS
jgi:endonuclease-3